LNDEKRTIDFKSSSRRGVRLGSFLGGEEKKSNNKKKKSFLYYSSYTALRLKIVVKHAYYYYVGLANAHFNRYCVDVSEKCTLAWRE
jgi:hypothetical protein